MKLIMSPTGGQNADLSSGIKLFPVMFWLAVIAFLYFVLSYLYELVKKRRIGIEH